jgi:hypothetical protein
MQQSIKCISILGIAEQLQNIRARHRQELQLVVILQVSQLQLQISWNLFGIKGERTS